MAGLVSPCRFLLLCAISQQSPIDWTCCQVKAAFTRTFNKESHKVPYAVTQAAKKGKKRGTGGASMEEELELEGGEEQDASGAEESDDDVTNDAMIKVTEPLTVIILLFVFVITVNV